MDSINSITRIKNFISNCFPDWTKVDFSIFDNNINFRKDLSDLYRIKDEEVILISYTNISITGTDRQKPQLRVFLDEYKKPFLFAKKHNLRFYLFSIFTKEDEMARGLNNFNPKEYLISIETNLDFEDSRRDLRSIYEYANEKLKGRKFLKCSRENYNANINQASFIYIGTPDAPERETFENFIDIFDSRPYIDSKIDTSDEKTPVESIGSLQQIFYGAPGTGKSNTIKREVDYKGFPNVRTTFHPDSDYSTFVGAYKPTSVEVPMMTMIGTKAVPVENPDGTQRNEKKIVYEFVPQAFLKAYTGAWKNQDKPFFLIIEEINRGNCAQIFGDLFQLLDRNDETELSDYSISPDEDIQKFLLTDKKYGFADLTDEQKAAIPEKVLSGELMILPKNLHIWATMNTSDQSLFPIDSAFKRRWDWQYMPISDGKKGWQIEANGKLYDWWQFLQKMNDKIGDKSEDKKLGYFFCKAKNGVIDAETLVGKVVFYIWNDVFKDFAEEAGDLFKDEEGILSFSRFYTVDDNGKTIVQEDKVELFLHNLGIEPIKTGKTDGQGEKTDTL